MEAVDVFGDSKSRYEAWVNNRVMALSMTIQVNKRRVERSLLRHEFFLDEIEHHFINCYSGKKVWNAFRYLRLYLRSYPHMKPRHQQKALEMLDRIYTTLGFEKGRISGDGRRVLRGQSCQFEIPLTEDILAAV